MTRTELENQCKDICPHCKAGEAVRLRIDTFEFVHDFSFGDPDPKLGRRAGFGHGICHAHDLRKEWEGKLSG